MMEVFFLGYTGNLVFLGGQRCFTSCRSDGSYGSLCQLTVGVPPGVCEKGSLVLLVTGCYVGTWVLTPFKMHKVMTMQL